MADGLINVIALGLTVGATIAAPLIVYAKAKTDKEAGKLTTEIQKINAELTPVYKNGSIVTTTQLDEKLSAMEHASNRRHDNTQKMLAVEIDHIKQLLQRLETKNTRDHNFTKDDLEEILNSAIRKNRVSLDDQIELIIKDKFKIS